MYFQKANEVSHKSLFKLEHIGLVWTEDWLTDRKQRLGFWVGKLCHEIRMSKLDLGVSVLTIYIIICYLGERKSSSVKFAYNMQLDTSVDCEKAVERLWVGGSDV